MVERQAGLGRSLEEVLDSLTPVEQDANALGRVLFEPEALEEQLHQLMGDVAALRERVQHLVGLVPDDAVTGVAPDAEPAATTKPKKHEHENENTKKNKKKKKKKKKSKGKNKK